MTYALVWIEVLVGAFLWIAASVALTVHIPRRWVRHAVRSILLAVPMCILGLLVVWAASLRFLAHLENNWFVYALSLFLCALAGMAAILRRSRPPAPGMTPAAREWQIGLLLAAWLAVMAVLGMSIWNIDITLQARINVLALEAQTRWMAELPALVSDDQNAAPLYQEALDRLRADPPSDVENPPLGNHDTFDPHEPATIAFLARHVKTIALLRRAAALPVLRFDQDLATPSIATILAPLNEYRNAANVLALDAQYEVSRGNPAAALADIQAIYGFSRHVGQRPLFVSALVALGIDALATRRLQDALSAVKSPSDLTPLNLNTLPSGRRILYRGIQSDKCFGLDQFRNGFGRPGTRAPFPVFMLSDEVDAYLQVLDDIAQAVMEPYVKAKPRLAQLTADYGPNHYHKGMMAGILASSLSRAIEQSARIDAGDACAHAAVAMTRFRLDQGRPPDRLDQLVPAYLDAIPLDPFDGQPLRLVIRNGQWILYSIGPDSIDNGGTAPGDLLFTLTLAPPTTNP